MPSKNITFQAVRPVGGERNATASSANINDTILSTPRLQLVGTRGHIPNDEPAADTYTYGLSRMLGRAPAVRVGSMRALLCNFYADSTAEADASNVCTIEACIETLTPVKTYPFTWNGSKTVTPSVGAGLFLSDPLGVTLDAGTWYGIRVGQTVSDGTKQMLKGHVSIGGSPIGGENFKRSTDASTTYSTGFFGAGNGIQGDSAGVMTVAGLVGIPATPIPAIAIFGDSIAAGSGDTTTGKPSGTYFGLYDRGTYDYDGAGNYLPHVNYAIAGTSASGFTPLAYYRFFSILEYTTHALVAIGTNDISGGGSLADLQTNITAIWNACKARGNKVIAATVLPRTTGTYTSDAGQTVVSGWAAGGIRDQYNAWLYTQLAAGVIDHLIDANPVLESPTARGKWARTAAGAAYTSDGVHPNPAGHTAGMEPVRQVLATLTAV